MRIPRVPHDFVIRYVNSRSYFKGMQKGRPYFDLGILDAPKYESEEAARAQVNKFPPVAQVMCDVVPRRK